MSKIIFVCEDSIESILSSIYTAFEYCKKGYSPLDLDIIINSSGSYDIELFATYIHIDTDIDKASKTINHIKHKLGFYIYTDVLRTLCHYDNNRGTILFKYLYDCFKYGASEMSNLSKDYVRSIMEMSRKVGNEAHHYYGFVRFNNYNGILYSQIQPKCNIIPMIIEHFSDRFPCENWIIEDKTRKTFAVHKAFGDTQIIIGEYDIDVMFNNSLQINDEYEELWKIFFDSIAIKERENKNCQRNLLPLWMRTYMNEFKN